LVIVYGVVGDAGQRATEIPKLRLTLGCGSWWTFTPEWRTMHIASLIFAGPSHRDGPGMGGRLDRRSPSRWRAPGGEGGRVGSHLCAEGPLSRWRSKVDNLNRYSMPFLGAIYLKEINKWRLGNLLYIIDSYISNDSCISCRSLPQRLNISDNAENICIYKLACKSIDL
jgi:hypothetical protein